MNISYIKGDVARAKVLAQEALQNGDVVLALDLDCTLAHYKDGMKGLIAIVRQLGVSESLARKVILATNEGNFSFSHFYHILTRVAHIYESEEKFMKRVRVWFQENYVLYDDAHRFLYDYLERIPIVVVTTGDDEFQREKVKLLDFIPHEILVVPVGSPKIDMLKGIYNRYRKMVVVVDDNPAEHISVSLDAWFGFSATSYSVRITRDDSPYQQPSGPLAHVNLEIRSFDQLRQYLTCPGLVPA